MRLCPRNTSDALPTVPLGGLVTVSFAKYGLRKTMVHGIIIPYDFMIDEIKLDDILWIDTNKYCILYTYRSFNSCSCETTNTVKYTFQTSTTSFLISYTALPWRWQSIMEHESIWSSKNHLQNSPNSCPPWTTKVHHNFHPPRAPREHLVLGQKLSALEWRKIGHPTASLTVPRLQCRHPGRVWQRSAPKVDTNWYICVCKQ